MSDEQAPIQLELPLPFPELSGDTSLLPARMINEFQYCRRLAYLEWFPGNRRQMPLGNALEFWMVQNTIRVIACQPSVPI